MPENAAAEVVLELDGLELRGWTGLSISRSIEQLAATFTVQATELEPDDPLKREIQEDLPVAVRLGDDLVLRGYIFDVETSYGPATHTITVSGADGSADLADCSANRQPGSWKHQKLEQIAGDLIKPFEGAYMLPGDDTGQPLEKFNLNTGETVFSALSRGARRAGLIVLGDGLGGVRVAKPGGELAPTRIDRTDPSGGRVKSATIRSSMKGRHSVYRVLGQTPSAEGSELIAEWGAAAGPPQQGTATDPGVMRYRPKILMENSAGDAGRLRKRALIEASTRAARAKPVAYTIEGWRSADGWLWQPGYRVPVFDPLLGIGESSESAREMLIVSVDYSLGANGGQVVSLKLLDPVAFTPEPLPPDTPKPALWTEGA